MFYSSDASPLIVASLGGHTGAIVCLLAHGASVELVDGQGKNAFLVACEAGHADVVRVLLESTTQNDYGGEERAIALHKSVLNDHADVTRLLLRYGSFRRLLSVHGSTLLHLAIHDNCLTAAQALLDAFVNPNDGIDFAVESRDSMSLPEPKGFHDRKEVSPLYRSTLLRDYTMVTVLITAGANVVPQNGCLTPFEAAFRNDDAEIVALFMQHKADPLNPVLWKGHNAFWGAAYFGAKKVLELLFETFSGLSYIDRCASEALIAAARGGHLNVLKITLQNTSQGHSSPPSFPLQSCEERRSVILEKGADDGTSVASFGSPLWHATYGGHHDVVRWLLAEGVDPNSVITANQALALHAAASSCSVPILTDLLSYGADANRLDLNGSSALEHALGLINDVPETGTQRLEAVRLLLLAKASPNKRGSNGDSILLRAIASGTSPEIVRELANHGADVNDRNPACSSSITPLYFAASKGWYPIVATLLAWNSTPDLLVHGDTAYSSATRNQHEDVARLLYNRGGHWGQITCLEMNGCRCFRQLSWLLLFVP